MNLTSDNPMLMLMILGVFGVVVSLWMILLLLVVLRHRTKKGRMQSRLGLKLEAGAHEKELKLWLDGHEEKTLVLVRDEDTTWRSRLRRLHHAAGYEMPLGALMLNVLGLEILALLAGLIIFKSVLLGIGMALSLLLLLHILLQHRIRHQEEKFEKQLVDALGLAARSLRAGHPLIGSFQMIEEEMPSPVKDIFGTICQQQAMGSSLEDALRRVCLNENSVDLKLFATSIIIQLRSGGNLADLMERLSEVIKERMRLSRKVRTLTAQTQFSKNTLVVLPFLVFALLSIVSPKYMSLLHTTDVGQLLLIGALVFVFAGAWVMNKMAVLHY